MDEAALRGLLDEVRAGTTTADEAVGRLRRLPFADLGFARIDHHRVLRQGVAEAVYAPGKTPAQCAAIVAELLSSPGAPVLLTRAQPEQVEACLVVAPGGRVTGTTIMWRPAAPRSEKVVVVAAGTADLPVADECIATLGAYGVAPRLLADVGVAGIHRLLADLETIADAAAVVVVAGMEGALASVVGGITPAPVVAVPTSVGYGPGLAGVTALLAMMASCAAGVTVMGIDNGFGAACAVARILDVRTAAGDRGAGERGAVDGAAGG
ncbi:MAG: nickel pincer cofactor biosynthesis protein LarB [Actinomycetota bacterium]|nr:nickel pincer cofactor biosynthesis protein LarB [Actinomycetota bacterium]